MVKEQTNFIYDSYTDRLMISRKMDGEVVEGSIRLMDIVFDITTDGRVANIELIYTSDYLDSIGISPKILKNIIDASFTFREARGGYAITIIVKSGKKSFVIPYNILVPKRNQAMAVNQI